MLGLEEDKLIGHVFYKGVVFGFVLSHLSESWQRRRVGRPSRNPEKPSWGVYCSQNLRPL